MRQLWGLRNKRQLLYRVSLEKDWHNKSTWHLVSQERILIGTRVCSSSSKTSTKIFCVWQFSTGICSVQMVRSTKTIFQYSEYSLVRVSGQDWDQGEWDPRRLRGEARTRHEDTQAAGGRVRGHHNQTGHPTVLKWYKLGWGGVQGQVKGSG